MNNGKAVTPHRHASRMVLYFLVLLIALSIANDQFIKPQGLVAYIGVALIEILSVMVAAFFYTRKNPISIRAFFRLNPIDAETVFKVILIGLCAHGFGVFVNVPMVLIVSQFGEIPTNELLLPSSIPQLVTGIIAIAIVPAIFEEVLARGILLREYEGYGTKAAIIGSAVYFGVMHLDFIKLPFTIFLGVVLAVVVLRTNSLYSAMIIHFINNLLALVQSYLIQVYDVSADGQTEKIYSFIVSSVYMLLAVGFLFVFVSFLKNYNSIPNNQLKRFTRLDNNGNVKPVLNVSVSMIAILCIMILFSVFQMLEILNIGGIN